MKKFLFPLLAVLTIAAACNTEEIKVFPAASFVAAVPAMEDECAIFKIALHNYSGEEPVSFPVTFGGDAVRDVDYKVSADAFTFGVDSVAAITVTSLKFGTGRSVVANLELPDGWEGGRYLTSEYALPDNLGYLSFERDSLYMTDSLAVTLRLYDADGRYKSLVKGDEIAVFVDTEKSTAVEGTDFRFVGNKSVVIEPGTGAGIVSVKLIGEEVSPGHDKIVLFFEPGDRFGTGQFAETEITIGVPEPDLDSDSTQDSDSDSIEG